MSTLLERLDAAGLTGRGGAAFSTATKLRAAHANDAHLLVNGCDGERGAGQGRVGRRAPAPRAARRRRARDGRDRPRHVGGAPRQRDGDPAPRCGSLRPRRPAPLRLLRGVGPPLPPPRRPRQADDQDRAVRLRRAGQRRSAHPADRRPQRRDPLARRADRVPRRRLVPLPRHGRGARSATRLGDRRSRPPGRRRDRGGCPVARDPRRRRRIGARSERGHRRRHRRDRAECRRRPSRDLVPGRDGRARRVDRTRGRRGPRPDAVPARRRRRAHRIRRERERRGSAGRACSACRPSRRTGPSSPTGRPTRPCDGSAPVSASYPAAAPAITPTG